MKIKANVGEENAKQKSKFSKLKQKYDKDGVQVIEDEQQIGKDARMQEMLNATRQNDLASLRDMNDMYEANRRDGSSL